MKKIILIIVLIVLIVFNKINEEQFNNKKNLNINNISIMIEDEEGGYIKSELDTFPFGMILDEDLTNCTNASTINYDEFNQIIEFTNTIADDCVVYFKSRDLDNLSNEILKNNGGQAYILNKKVTDFGLSTTESEGMYATIDNYGISFYFRGAVDNNWLIFGEEDGKPIYWRIVRINGDSSVRLIYSGVNEPTYDERVNIINGASIQRYKINSKASTAEYSGYMYTLGEQHGTENSSDVKILLESWYEENIISYNDYITDTIFCYDRTSYTDKEGNVEALGYGTDTQYFGSYIRINTYNNPSLECENKLDRFTVNDSDNANAVLDFPIGLLTSDEAVFAGYRMTGVVTHSTVSYITIGENQWLGTPFHFSSNASNYYIHQNSALHYYYVHDTQNIAIRPVINIKSDVKVSGTGEYNNPYIIM